MLKIGSHVSMSAPNFLLGSVNEALSYKANALMLYTGAPQNTFRKSIDSLKVDEMKKALEENNIPLENVIVHAPYIINLANTVKEETYELAVSFLKQELERVDKIGAKYLVLHPGSHVKAGDEIGLESIIKGLNEANINNHNVIVTLETMAGKGSELGVSFEQIKYIIDHVNHPECLAVCLDTCHIHDAGYDLNDFDAILKQFDSIIGLDKLKVLHINDSKNVMGAHKDRHANLGKGEIGFDNLYKVVHHPLLEECVKILETPYVNGKAPYKYEIEMLRNNEWKDIEEILQD